MPQAIADLPELLLPWYQKNARDLPWRKDREPYHVWLSEIMLQQTRVEAVKGYYARFLEACPDIPTLAAAPEDQLNKLWQGLGYYSRVRNLQKAARQIMQQHNGQFPEEYAAIRALPGIGPYTAGAISSICFEQPRPAVDGNVLRVITRLLADPTPIDKPAFRRQITEQLSQIYPQGQCGAFTQSLMELGAIVCLPNGEPHCDVCPLQEICWACKTQTQRSYPAKAPKLVRRREEKTVFILRCGDHEAVEKRAGQGLLAGLWQYPNVDGTLTATQAIDQAEQWGVHPAALVKKVTRTHIFTHITWEMTAYYFHCRVMADPFTWATDEEMKTKIALPTAFHKFREEEE